MPYNLFLSYSRRDDDHGRTTELVERIERDFALREARPRALLLFFDRQEIH